MWKNVVLPAPLGPIRLTIERSGISKSTELTATSPPKSLLIPRASRMFATTPSLCPSSSGTGHSLHRAGIFTVQLLRALAVGNDAFRSQEHHQDQDYAEQEEVVLRDIRLAEKWTPDGVADGVDPLVDLRQQVEVQAL